jgi:hypothetical protein
MASTTWTCSTCGAVHEGTPLEWGFQRPDYWNQDRDETEGFLSSDLCTIPTGPDEFDYFVRGVIEIPISDGGDEADRFGIGAWVSLSERNFKRYVDHWEAGEHEQGEPWFGWLSNSVPGYPETLSLKTNVYLRGERLRPRIELQPSDHPLAVDAHQGITLARAYELAGRWQHG